MTYEKRDVNTLLQVSSTTFAILISLGLALPQIFPDGSAIEGMTSFIWTAGTALNLAVVMYPLVLYIAGDQDEPNERWTRVFFIALILSYAMILLAAAGINFS